MRDLKLGTDGDLDLTGGGASIVEGAPAVVQRLTIRLRLFASEWFLDRRKGVPYYERILVKNPDLGVVAATLQAVVLKTEGIVRLLTYQQRLDTDARALIVSLTAEATDGSEVILNEVALP